MRECAKAEARQSGRRGGQGGKLEEAVPQGGCKIRVHEGSFAELGNAAPVCEAIVKR
jgi:hypothetical protein